MPLPAPVSPATAAFDLLDDPWIPAVSLVGKPCQLGLLDCLAEAHALREIDDASPLGTYGIHRFLAAVFQRYLPVADLDEWEEHWNRGHFPADLIDRVREGCQGRLDLFHPTRPFYQTGDIPLAGKPSDPLKTVGYLFPELSTGTNVTLFAHPGDSDHAVCPVCCARALLTLPAFAMSGGAGLKPGINGVPPIYLLPRGTTLFQTLLLNHLTPQFWPSQSDGSGTPLWEEATGVIAAKDERATVGFVESLTFPPRRIRLIPSDGGVCSYCGASSAVLVRRMVFGPGRARPKDLPVWDDPWAAYEERETASQSKRLPIRPREDRDVWRDFTSLFVARGEENRGKTRIRPLRPLVLRQVDQLIADGTLPATERVSFTIFGLRTDMKAKVFEWRQDGFDFPPAILLGEAAAEIETALARAERVGELLGHALERLHPAAGRQSPDWGRIREASRDLVTLWRRAYWQRLEPRFRALLVDPRLIDSQLSRSLWGAEWGQEVRSSGREALESAIDATETDGPGLGRNEHARSYFYSELSRVAPSPAASPRSANAKQEQEGR